MSQDPLYERAGLSHLSAEDLNRALHKEAPTPNESCPKCRELVDPRIVVERNNKGTMTTYYCPHCQVFMHNSWMPKGYSDAR